ncbi:MAG TPA: RecX family transcriptional regulator [Verrucomicrobiae bacterium]|nr:RecX family transcriptional regulator [Verrucomicrobiae bacterium]
MPKVTAIKGAVKTKGRYNIFIDGSFSFSLSEAQLIDSGVRVGLEITEQRLAGLKDDSAFGKAYARALEYIFRRPRSRKEIETYAYRKQWPPEMTAKIVKKLEEKNYINDTAFAESWVRSRQATKPSSKRKLTLELRQKGVDAASIEQALEENDFDELGELRRIVDKRRHRYTDEQKFMAYLARQGFSFDAIKQVLRESEDS